MPRFDHHFDCIKIEQKNRRLMPYQADALVVSLSLSISLSLIHQFSLNIILILFNQLKEIHLICIYEFY
jgi:hypothetical protein